MRLVLHVRDLVLASWKTDRESVARVLPAGLEPAAVAGDYLVSLVALAYDGGQLGPFRVRPFSQLNVRTYVAFGNEPAVFFLRAHVTAVGMVGIVFGAPYRPARIAVRSDAVEAAGLGVSVRFRAVEPADPAELARHELGLFEAAGLRGFRVRRGSAEWQRATPLGPSRADVVLAAGFDTRAEPSLLHARGASFETEVPPRRVDTRLRRRRSCGSGPSALVAVVDAEPPTGFSGASSA